jgi:glycosyltransferase involved in cell wall biosynthesis
MISVIVPYNEDRGWLGKCIDSIKNQTYKNFELIEAKGPGTLPENFNAGLRRAKGEFIKMVQDDDWLPEAALQYLSEGIEDNAWLVGNVWQECTGRYIYKPPYLDFEKNLNRYALHMGSTLYRKDVLEAIGGMDETLETGEEYDMHLKLLSLYPIPGYIDKEVYHYRMWNGGKSRIFRRKRTNWRKNELAKIKNRYTG